MPRLIMRLKSGREFKFSCKTYRLEKYKIDGKLCSFEYTGGVGECPVYFDVNDIEAIIETIYEDGEVGHIYEG